MLSLTSRSPSHSPLETRKELKQEPPSFTGGDTSAAHPHLTRPPAARLHPALPRALSPPQHLCWETGSSDGCLAIGGGLTSVILIVLSTVSPQLQGWFVPVSLRPALQTVPAYVTAAVCSSRSLTSALWGFGMYKSAQRTRLRILPTALRRTKAP